MATTRHLYQAQVRWSDGDVMGHINHARFLSYFEDARMALMAESPSGLAGAPGDRGYIAARIAVDYQAPVAFRPGLALSVSTGVTRLGTTSWTLHQRLADDQREVAQCECVLVGYCYPTARPRRLDPDEREFWSRYLAAVDGRADPSGLADLTGPR